MQGGTHPAEGYDVVGMASSASDSGAAIGTGHVDFVLPLQGIPGALITLTRSGVAR